VWKSFARQAMATFTLQFQKSHSWPHDKAILKQETSLRVAGNMLVLDNFPQTMPPHGA
jgi:hypothetical protein